MYCSYAVVANFSALKIYMLVLNRLKILRSFLKAMNTWQENLSWLKFDLR